MKLSQKILLPLLLLIPSLIYSQDKIGYLGVRTIELSSAMKTAIGVEYGVLIEEVVENSPAQNGGLRSGDVIMKVNNEKILDKKILSSIIEAHPGDKVMVMVFRDRHKKLFKITLGEREKSKLKFEMNLPNLPDFNALMGRNTKELKKDIEAIKRELEELKKEIKDLKKKIK